MCPMLRGGRSGRARQCRRGAPPCATLCPGLLLPRPPLSGPAGPNAASPSRQQRAFPGCGAGAPRHDLSDFCCGGASALRPVPQLPRGFSRALEAPAREGPRGAAGPARSPLTASSPRSCFSKLLRWALAALLGPRPVPAPPGPNNGREIPVSGVGGAGPWVPALRAAQRGSYTEFGILSLTLVLRFQLVDF